MSASFLSAFTLGKNESFKPKMLLLLNQPMECNLTRPAFNLPRQRISNAITYSLTERDLTVGPFEERVEGPLSKLSG